MGVIMSTVNYLFGKGEEEGLDIVDKDTGLTKREKQAVTSSWQMLKVNLTQSGIELFMSFFKAHPKNIDYFPQFKGKDFDKIRKSAMMKVHGVTVMNALNAFVDNLDDPECLVGLLQKNASNHYSKGIRIHHYKELFDVFPTYLQERMDGKCDQFTVNAWGKVTSVMVAVIGEELTKQSNAK